MDGTDKTAEAVAAVNQVSSGNTDGAFEPGPLSPFAADGSIRRTRAQAEAGYGHWVAATIRDEDASRQAEAVRLSWVRGFSGDH